MNAERRLSRLSGAGIGVALALALAGAPAPLQAGPAVTIRVETDRTGGLSTYDPYSSRPGQNRLAVTSECLVFHIRATALAPPTIQVDWALITTTDRRQLQASSPSQATLTFPKFNRQVQVRTSPIARDTRPGSQNERTGYAIRVIDPATGTLLGERYDPARARDIVEWPALPATAKPPSPPPRPTVPPPSVH